MRSLLLAPKAMPRHPRRLPYSLQSQSCPTSLYTTPPSPCEADNTRPFTTAAPLPLRLLPLWPLPVPTTQSAIVAADSMLGCHPAPWPGPSVPWPRLVRIIGRCPRAHPVPGTRPFLSVCVSTRGSRAEGTAHRLPGATLRPGWRCHSPLRAPRALLRVTDSLWKRQAPVCLQPGRPLRRVRR